MATALQELTARLDDLRANVHFVTVAASLRPRLGELINWNAGANAIALGQEFMDAKSSRPEGLYGALLVRVIAAFERYARQLIDYAVEETAAKAQSFGDIAERVRIRNTVLTGRALASIEVPRYHLSLDYQLLADNLSSCKTGSTSFHLNAPAFSAIVTGGSPAILERALENVNVSEWWDAVGRSAALQKVLGTRKTRETGQRARDRLTELWRWRNHIAHAGDEDITLSEEALSDAINFVGAFASALDKQVRQRLA